ncbi:hypothetical protein [Brachybacterium vulturis]|uniref:hypothetical protein n=1 Tax=Brachybacterium vulturis TaxID=2017484 RepID=UPI003736D0A1
MRGDRVLSEREIVAALCRRDPAVFAMGLSAARILGFPLPGVVAQEVVAAPEQKRRGTGRSAHGPGRGGVDLRIHLGTGQSRRRR